MNTKAKTGRRNTRTIKTIGIVAKETSRVAINLAAKAAGFLSERGVSVLGECFDPKDCGPGIRKAGEGGISRESDLILVLGGDGTFIRAVSMIHGRKIPVLGVNMGSLGYLTDVTRDELFETLEYVIRGDFKCEERMRLRACVHRDKKKVWMEDVLNEVVVSKNALSPTIQVNVTADGLFVSRFRGDGLMAATPTGSTAYNLSADGPIVHPALRCILLTPISPHMLADRPIILPHHSKVVIRLSVARDGTFATFDGSRGIELIEGDEVSVESSPHPVYVVIPRSRDYFNVLRTKLKWGGE